MLDLDIVHAGDIVLLKVRMDDPTKKAFVTSDGIVNDDLHIVSVDDVNVIDDIRDCLFRVVFKLNYNAAKDYHRCKRDGASEEEMMPVREKFEAEETQNLEKMKRRAPVTYGESIQLLHIKSNKFVTILPRQGATFMRQARHVEVRDQATAHSCFRVAPFYRHKNAGEPLRFEEQALCQAGKLGTKWYLHWTREPYTVGEMAMENENRHEVNCSTISTQGFFFVFYARSAETMNFAHTVRLYHTQSQGFFTASAGNPINGKPKKPFLRCLDVDNYEDPNNLCSKSVWVVENPSRIQGGPLTWGCEVCLMHVGTGRYLAVDKEMEGSNYLCTMKDMPDGDCRFVLNRIDQSSKAKEIPNTRPKVLISFRGWHGKELWLTNGDRKPKPEDLDLSRKKRKASMKLIFNPQRKIRDAIQIDLLEKESPSGATIKYVTDVNTVIGRKRFIVEFKKDVDTHPKKPLPKIPPGSKSAALVMAREEESRKREAKFKVLEDCLVESIFFCAPTTEEPSRRDALKAPMTCDGARQRICRELKYIDATIDLHYALWKAGYKITKKSSRAEADLGGPPPSAPAGKVEANGHAVDSTARPLAHKGKLKSKAQQAEEARAAAALPEETLPLEPRELRVLKLLLQLWQRSFLGNTPNQNYFEYNKTNGQNWMGLINSLNGLGLGAAQVFMSLVAGNLRLVMRINLQIILDFVAFIKELGPDDTWPMFMKTVCSCEGTPISAKQQTVLQVIYDQGANATVKETTEWGKNKEECLLNLRLGEVAEPFPSSAPRANPNEMLAARLVDSGVRDILVTWFSKEEQWGMACSFFYFSPKMLQLPTQRVQGKEYVALKDLVWVLDPDHFYHKVHKCEPDEWPRLEKEYQKDKFQKNRLKAMGVLSNYFNAQLDMLAEMCFYRQVNCILSIEREYTFEMLICGIWCSSLPPAVHCACAFLLDNLWLDRHPHMEMSMPNLIRNYNMVDPNAEITLPKFELLVSTPDGHEVTEFYTIASAKKFDLLVASIEHHLTAMNGIMVHKQRGHNKYTRTLCEIQLHLFHFGFVSQMRQLYEMLQPMLRAMDGRTDFMDDPAKTAQGHKPATDAPAAPPTNAATPLLASARDVSMKPPGPGVELHNEAHRPLPPDGEAGKARYKWSEDNQVLMDCKTYMCKVCEETLELAQDHCISKVVQIFKLQLKKGLTKDQLVDEDAVTDLIKVAQDPQFDFGKVGRTEFMILVLDLLMYSGPKLFNCAMSLLHSWAHHLKKVLLSLSKTQLLIGDDDVAAYESVRKDVQRLGNNFATHECWGCEDSFGPIEMDRVSETKLLCIRLRQICSQGGVGNDSAVPNHHVQEDLRNLRLIDVVKDAFQIRIEEITDMAQVVLKDMMKLVCDLVTQFLNGHQENQQDMFNQLFLLRHWFNYGVGVANCIAMVFTGNRRLCENVPEDIVYDFGRTLAKRSRGFLPHQLSFLLSIVAVGQRPILRNKQCIVEMLKMENGSTYGEGKVLHFLQGPTGRKRKAELLWNFDSMGELSKPEMFRKWKGHDSEIMYHIKCVDLFSLLCLGRDQVGGTAYVQSLLHASDMAVDFLEVHDVQTKAENEKPPNYKSVVFICRVLKAAILNLLRCCYFDTDMKDKIFLSSSILAQVLELIQEEFLPIFQSPDGQAQPVSKEDEEFVITTLHSLNAYFEFGYSPKTDPEDIRIAVEKHLKVLSELSQSKYSVPQDDSVFRRAVSRAIGYLKNDEAKKRVRTVKVELEDEEHQSEADKTRHMFKNFIKGLENHPRIKNQIKADHDVMVSHVMLIPQKTDTINPDYQKEKAAALAEGRNLNVDFRRNQIRLEEIVGRMVIHCLENLRETDSTTPWATTQRVLEILVDVLLVGRQKLQKTLATAGAVKLVISTLMAQPDDVIGLLALRLGILLLEPNNPYVQDEFRKQFYSIDDSGLWIVLDRIYEQCIGTVKHVRTLKQVKRLGGGDAGLLTDQEELLITLFEKDCQNVIYAMRLQQVLCEGHLEKMQSYIFQQTDNSVSFNFLERSVDVCIKMCKNEAACDIMDESELAVLSQGVDLLVEVMQGPCEKNQQYISVSGLVEMIQKVLKAKFKLLRTIFGSDPYPESVRRIKASLLLSILSMLETRRDKEVHKNVLYRLDIFALKHRLIFIHRYFCSHIMNFGECNLDDLAEPDNMKIPDKPPETFLEEFVDAQLQDWFDEAFNIMMLIHQIKCIGEESEEFRKVSLPTIPAFKDDPNVYADTASYLKEKKLHREAVMYNKAYHFFDRWIRPIEIIVASSDGSRKLYDYYFRMPVLCDFVPGAAKRDITEKIIIDSPDEKAKDFVRRSLDAYEQTVHTRSLSKWSMPIPTCCPSTIRKPLTFFLKHDAKQLMAIAKYTLQVAVVINSILMYALILPKEGPPQMISIEAKIAVQSLGGIYVVMMAVSLIVNCLLYCPLDYRAFAQECTGPKGERILITLVMLLPGTVAGIAADVLISPFMGVIVQLVQLSNLSKQWKGKSCPNNKIALLIKTFISSLQKQPIFRRTLLTVGCILALCGQYYYYPMLLLDLVFHKPMLQNVLKAVTIPLSGLIWTTIVGIIIMYSYAVLAFYLYRSDFDGACENMVDCTFVTVYQGFRQDIGSAIKGVDPSSDNWYSRVGYDLSYFVVMTTIFMNVIAGMVIDTFGSLRDATQQREEYAKNTCFISCLDRGEVDKCANSLNIELEGCNSGFDFLETKRQNKWNYLSFIFYLKRKDITEYTGPEKKVTELLAEQDIGWLPLLKCHMMEAEDAMTVDADEAEDAADDLVMAEIQKKVGEIATNLVALNDQVKTLMPAEKKPADPKAAAKAETKKK